MTKPTEREYALIDAWEEYSRLSKNCPVFYELEPLIEADGFEDVPKKLMAWIKCGKPESGAVGIANHLTAIAADYLSDEIDKLLEEQVAP